MYCKRRDNFLHLEGTMIFVVQLLRWLACFNVVPTKHDQVSYLVHWRFLSCRICVLAHVFPGHFQTFSGFIVYHAYPVQVDCAGWVEGFALHWIHGYGVESVVGIERGHTVGCCGRLVVSELRHWQQVYPVQQQKI